MWVRPVAEQKEKKTEDSPPGPPLGEGVALSPPPPEEQSPTSPSCPCQRCFIFFLDDFVWFDRRTNYTRSLAVMSMVGYILGLGDSKGNKRSRTRTDSYTTGKSVVPLCRLLIQSSTYLTTRKAMESIDLGETTHKKSVTTVPESIHSFTDER
ncbi:hypothetical protein cypCar_00039870 [Cyprinus carpio]|nr:hypothetical protein cypCar_00039870 [Cyprinus carpio]